MKRTVSLPLNGWPEADRVLWTALITGDDTFGDEGALAHLRATSKAGLIKHYGRWLEWVFQSEPDVLDQAPAERATPERLAAWIASLHHVTPPTLFNLVYGVLRILKAAAPELDWKKQSHAAKRLQGRVRRYVSKRKTGRVLSSAVLYDAALDMVGPKATSANTPLNAALMRRGGTMIALLAFMPIRLRSLTELRLGTSVLISPSRIVISLTGDMTKNNHPWEAQVPKSLELVLRAYVDEVRAWLMHRKGKQHQMLWVGRMGEPLTYGTIKNTVPIATKREIGIAISPHLFRDSAATTLIRESPKDALATRALLGHSSFAITDKHYNHAKGIEAGRDYAEAVTKRRMGTV